jgi:hypothetical protein
MTIALGSISACRQPQPITTQATVTPTSIAISTQALATTAAQPALTAHNFLSPTWSQLQLPPGCSFHSLSPNLRWIVMMGCPSESGATNLIAQVDENGMLHNSRQIEGRLVPYDEQTGITGFTSDSTQLILEQNKTYWLINLSDLTQVPYASGTAGTSGIEHFGSERWSPNGRFWLSPDCWGCGQVFVASPSDQAKETVLDNVGRHGAQFNWSADGKEIVYVEGDYHESMKASVIDLKTRQSRTLVERQYPVSLTGASYSPDGKWIAVREQNIESSEDAALWLIDVKTEAKTRLTYSLLDVEVYYGWQDLVWSPDSSRLALRGSSDDSEGFVVIEVPTGNVVYQGTEQTRGSPLAWSADGKSLLVLDFLSGSDTDKDFHLLRWVSIR